ncbi:MAG: glycosyltransferase family 2 protein [Thermoguttaceae bacterium]
MTILLSVIMPVRNESLHIEEVLDKLLAQDYSKEKYEILVVDGMSDDDTRAKVQKYVEKYPNVRLFENPKRLSSAARNVGVVNAQGEFVVVVDGHCIIDSDKMFEKIENAFQNPEVDCLGRPQPLELSHATKWQLAIAAARRSRIGHHPDSFIYSDQPCFCPAISVAVAYRKSVFDKTGLFDENFDAAEDCELNYRCDKAGLKCYFVPEIAVRYVPRATLGSLAKQLTRYGKGRVRLTRKHPETFSWKSFLPAPFFIGFVLEIILAMLFLVSLCMIVPFGFAAVQNSLAFQMLCWTFAATTFIFVLYGLILCAESILIAVQKRGLFYLWRLPFVFLTIHLAIGWGLVCEMLGVRR